MILLFIMESPLNYFDVPLLVLDVLGFGYVFRSVISEIFAGGLLKLIDASSAQTDRPIDPAVAKRHEKEISRLIHSGQREEAIKLCLGSSSNPGQLDRTVVDNTLNYLGVKQGTVAPTPPLVQVARLREQRDFLEAEKMLVALLRKNPADEGAGIMLMRIYAQDFRHKSAWRAPLLSSLKVSRRHAGTHGEKQSVRASVIPAVDRPSWCKHPDG